MRRRTRRTRLQIGERTDTMTSEMYPPSTTARRAFHLNEAHPRERDAFLAAVRQAAVVHPRSEVPVHDVALRSGGGVSWERLSGCRQKSSSYLQLPHAR